MIYSLGLCLYMFLAAPFYLARIRKGRYRESISPRLGRGLARVDGQVTLWIHACSVGEVEAAAPLIALVRRDRPDLALIVSTVTETGQARAQALFPFAAVRYLPYDFRFAVRRHLDAAGSLAGCIILETELWPNFIGELKRRQVPIAVANGRISDRAWPRYRLAAPFLRATLHALGLVAARTETDAARFRELGAPRVEVSGNVKFDRPAAGPLADPPQGRFLVFGSTHPGEETIALRVFGRLKERFPDLRLILAPRHTERGAAVAAETGGARRSLGWQGEPVLILDTHGELGSAYALGEVAVIGGSFVPVGGHNPLEAAVHGIPVLWGPHTANFRDACGLLENRGGRMVADEAELLATLEDLFSNATERKASGEAARATVLANRGAAERQWRAIGRSLRLLADQQATHGRSRS